CWSSPVLARSIPDTRRSLCALRGTAASSSYTLSLHDALPISAKARRGDLSGARFPCNVPGGGRAGGALERRAPSPGCRCASLERDRKSTRLNSSHVKISYAVFCLKKKSRGRL